MGLITTHAVGLHCSAYNCTAGVTTAFQGIIQIIEGSVTWTNLPKLSKEVVTRHVSLKESSQRY